MLYEDNYLAHHGVKGQKWGVRRYQNEDGSLTSEGRSRYENSIDRGDRGPVKKILGGEGGNYAFAKWRDRRHSKNIDKVKSKYDRKLSNAKSDKKREKLTEKRDKKLDKYESKKAAQSAANANLDAYRRHSSTAKLLLENAVLYSLGINASGYRHARARGTSRRGSLFEAATPIGAFVRMHRDKKAYGKRIVYSDMDHNDYYGSIKYSDIDKL